ncbi:MAG: hypothetical protein GXP38_08410 [Chloroflexi bacterium]|nr:hypothetical protein [Chloroflexota bacterium]
MSTSALSPSRRHLFWSGLFLTLISTVVLQRIDLPLRTAAAPQGIVSFELAGDVATAQAIVQSWDASARMSAGFSLGFDYLYMLAYATTFWLACLWAREQWHSGWGRRLGTTFAWAMPLAATVDALENYALWHTLHEVVSPWPQIARGAAQLKFTLLGLALVYVLVSLGRRGLKGRRQG